MFDKYIVVLRYRSTLYSKNNSVARRATGAATLGGVPSTSFSGVRTQVPGSSQLTVMSPTKRSGEVRLAAHVHTKVDSPHNPDFSALVRKVWDNRCEAVV